MNDNELKLADSEKKKDPIYQVPVNIFLLIIGSVFCAVAINGILIPHEFLSGGFSGLSLFIHYLLPGISVGIIYFLLNIPLYALGWRYVGRRFFLYSIAGMVIFSLCIGLIKVSIPVNDKILSAILAGIISGTGSGIILRSLGSAGGLDILCVITLKKSSISVGNSTLIFNSIILCFAAFVFSLDTALYTLIYIYVSAQIMNLVVSGLSKRKAVFIISDRWEDIARDILSKTRRGVTVIEGKGAYTMRDKNVLYTVIALQELPQLKALILKIDPQAFVVVTDTLEVIGQGVGNQPHW
ncbi:MAG: YitT family protein [Deltaproteobacteria bacterium]|nr:YitT family protein [Deltaproteobacteria bacterium]